MNAVFAYGAGLLTLINPCILPVLPIVLAGALQASRWGPLALAAGMSMTFVALGLAVSVLGQAFGLRPDDVAQAGAILMVGFGVVLLVPRLSAGFALATSGISAAADTRMDGMGGAVGGWKGQAMGGALLGAVWSPCVGPTLGGAISLASQGQSLWQAGVIMAGFALGVSTVILILGYGARGLLMRHRAAAMRVAQASRPILGAAFVLVGVGLLLHWDRAAEGWLLDRLPYWLQDLSVVL